jgi:hypothetical protein
VKEREKKKTRKPKKLRSSLHHSNNGYTEIFRDLQKQSCMLLNTYHNVPTDFIIISSWQWVKVNVRIFCRRGRNYPPTLTKLLSFFSDCFSTAVRRNLTT